MSAYREPGHQFETLAYTYQYAQNGEAGHGCPLACTAGLIKILQNAEGDFNAWLERLLDPDYATHFHGSQFLYRGPRGVRCRRERRLRDAFRRRNMATQR